MGNAAVGNSVSEPLHLCYRWNGHRADAWLVYGEEQWRPLP